MKAHGLRAILPALALVFFTASLPAASEQEVTVTGCVVDFGGQPYRRLPVSLTGLNYRGGAGYTDNNSFGYTDDRGQFSVRMKAGTRGDPARARVTAKWDVVHAISGWGGGWRPSGGADVWPETFVENEGEPVDLRARGCIRFPYPIHINGVITSEGLEGWHAPAVPLVITAVGDSARTSEYIAWPAGTREFDLNVDLRLGDKFSITIPIPELPKGVFCFVSGGQGVAGLTGVTTPLQGAHNVWTTSGPQVRCENRPEPPKEKEPERRIRADKPLLYAGEGVLEFYRDWDEREETLYGLGEKMVEWGTFDLYTAAGRAAFLRVCDDRIASARRRIADEANTTKTDPSPEETAIALPRRGANSATNQFRELNSTAADEERNPALRAQRLRADQLAAEREAREIADSGQNLGAMVAGVLGVVQGVAQVQAARDPRNSLAAALSQLPGQSQGRLGQDSGGIAGSPSSETGSGSEGCESALNRLSGPVNEGSPFLQSGWNTRGYTPAQQVEQDIWARQVYVRVANAHPACARDSQSRQSLAGALRSAQAQCRQAATSGRVSANCEGGRNYGVDANRLEAAIQKIMREGSAAATASSSAAAGRSSGSGTNPDSGVTAGGCRAASDQQEAEFNAINRRKPRSVETMPSIQLALYMTSERMKLLDRSCKGQPQYQEYAAAKQEYDATLRACLGIATSASTCVARVPW